MTNPLRILSGSNHADTGLITTGASAVSSLPASNLKDDDIQALWRSSSTSGDAIIVDFGSQVDIGVVALLNTNVRPADTAHVRISNSDPTGQAGEIHNSGAYTANVDLVWAQLAYFVEPPVLGRYLRLGLTMTQAPQAGRLVVANTWAPTRDMSFGWEPLWRDFSTRTRSLGGNEFIDVRPRQRGFRFALRGLTQSEAMAQVDELNRLRGIGRDILVCRDIDSDNLGRETIWGLLEEPARQRNTNPDFYEVEFEVYARI